MARLEVATCQFPVGADVDRNLGFILRQLRAARGRGAAVAHFPEGALSGYAVSDFEPGDRFDWGAIERGMDAVLAAARALGIWVVVGSAHRLTGDHKPHNSVYVVDDHGDLVDRYDKRFCSGGPDGASEDLAHYSPGDHPSAWAIDGVACGALVCYEYRFPELYREYARAGVQLVFHAFHAAHASARKLADIGDSIGAGLRGLNPAPTFSYPGITMPPAMTAAAASNHVWISASNSSARESLWPAFAVRADGITVGRLRRNVTGILLTTVDTDADLYDSTRMWRGRALGGVLHSGDLVVDERSARRTGL